MAKLEKGLVQVFAGAGKGKTEAALGIALRAASCGFKVYIIQMLKGNGLSTSVSSLENSFKNLKIDAFGRHCPYIDLMVQGVLLCDDCKECFIPPKKVKEMDKELARMALDLAGRVIKNGKHQVLVLDEILLALELKLVDAEEVIKLIKDKPEDMELVLTGRKAPPEIIELANQVTDMNDVKNLKSQGVKGRFGIDH